MRASRQNIMVLSIFKWIILLIISGLLLMNFLKAQDIHFSQFQIPQSVINPANSGNYNGDWRLVNIYRSQWAVISAPYQTGLVGFDRQYYISNTDIMTGGILLINDKSGQIGLTSNQLFLTGVYHKFIRKISTLIGFQAGYIHKKFSAGELTFPNQFDMSTGYFNNRLENFEGMLDTKSSFFDFNSGIIWKYYGKNFQPEFGLALYHINYSKSGFKSWVTENEINHSIKETTSKRFTASIKSNFIIGETVILSPALIYMTQNKANEIVAGMIMKYSLTGFSEKINWASTGISIRSGQNRNFDAVIFIAGLNYRKLEIGVSYDYNISELQIASKHRGAFEISLIYKEISTKHNASEDFNLRF
ncbi:MAG: PorP/SprF family type IX secretion system membrane protein [Bacteroidia bacterium]|nr:PorP/SprF family type IX secretion system membrane protein [Bacteroidia bacterium]